MIKLKPGDINRINYLYFEKDKTTKEISDELGFSKGVILRNINRKEFYLDKPNSKGNSIEECEIIENEVLDYFNMPKKILHKNTRVLDVIKPRQIAHLLAYNLTKSSYAFIGKCIGDKGHATVMHSKNEINGYLTYENRIKNDYIFLEEICKLKIKKFRDGRCS